MSFYPLSCLDLSTLHFVPGTDGKDMFGLASGLHIAYAWVIPVNLHTPPPPPWKNNSSNRRPRIFYDKMWWKDPDFASKSIGVSGFPILQTISDNLSLPWPLGRVYHQLGGSGFLLTFVTTPEFSILGSCVRLDFRRFLHTSGFSLP